VIVALMGGSVVDRSGRRRAHVLVRDGLIVHVGPDLDPPSDALVLDASGCVVSPGLVDLHTHLRQPGAEEAETVETGSRAAALGGYTAVVAMPNTEPAIDSAGVVREVRDLAATALCEVAVAGAITSDRAGERMAPIAEMAALGVRIFTDDGSGVQDGALMRRALDYARGLGVTLAEHCEDRSLGRGVMHEGPWSSRLGLPGVPAAAEETMLARDLALVRASGTPMHFLHLSTAGSAGLVRHAKAEGLPVTAEATPHHLSLTDARVQGYDPVFKVNPPLRGSADVLAIRRALAEGIIDAVATDHAPHTAEAKELAFADAPPGMLGLETALAVTLEAFEGSAFALEEVPDASEHRSSGGATDGPTLALDDLLARLSWLPARIAGLTERQGGPVEPGRPANLCVFDPSAAWVVDPARLASRSRNTPFAGRRLGGRVRHTLFEGVPTVIDAQAQR
jgi:dihydroorotase